MSMTEYDHQYHFIKSSSGCSFETGSKNSAAIKYANMGALGTNSFSHKISILGKAQNEIIM